MLYRDAIPERRERQPSAGHRRGERVVDRHRSPTRSRSTTLVRPSVVGAAPGRTTRRADPAVSVVIPTLNEATNLPHVLPLVSERYEVLIVDGGSVDDTVAVARRLRPDATVLRQPGRGKGDALCAGLRAASGDIIVTLDADGSQKASEIDGFVRALVAGADFAKGSRLIPGGGSADFTRLRALGNRMLGMAANVIHGTAYTDLTYGFNAFWRHCVPHIVNEARGFEGETIMCIRAARAGLRITEVPCYEERRIFGESNLSTFRDGWRILCLLVRERGRIPGEEPA